MARAVSPAGIEPDRRRRHLEPHPRRENPAGRPAPRPPRLPPSPAGETKAFYDAAIEDGLDVDALHLEAAFAKSLTDQADLAEAELTLLTQMGSRLSEPWYTASRRAAAEDRMAESEDLLLRAWQLEPSPPAPSFSTIPCSPSW